MKRFQSGISIFVALEATRGRWKKSSLLLWSNTDPFWRRFIRYKANRGTLSFILSCGTQESHTRRRNQTNVLFWFWTKETAQSHPLAAGEIGVLFLTPTCRDPCDRGSDEPHVCSSRKRVNILSHTASVGAPACKLHAPIARQRK